MPEGPSLVIARELLQKHAGKVVVDTSGNSRLDLTRMRRRRVLAFRTWGKHLLIEFPRFTMRVHFMLFGSYRIDERKDDAVPRMRLVFRTGEFNTYACSLQYIEADLDEVYDWAADVMSEHWDPKLARRRLKLHPERLAGDVLLDQTVFAGVGNIIRNEVLYRIGVHPESTIGALPPRKLGDLIREARNYSFDFLKWKRAYVLRKHWLAHTRRTCAKCGGPIVKTYPGTTRRRAFFCPACQHLYA